MSDIIETEISKMDRQLINKAIILAMSSSYGPLAKICNAVITKRAKDFEDSINACFDAILTKDFDQLLNERLEQKFVKILIDKCGGEIEKRVNEIRANPETRAKITLAVSKALKSL